MQCKIRAMGDNATISDTLPKRGRVNEVCKEWLVHEDGALAYKLQKQEVESHLSGNRSRNAIVREDFPKAKYEQRREEMEALRKYHEEIDYQAAQDARLAQQLAEDMAKEEDWKRRVEAEDQRIARQIQDKEKRKPLPPNFVGDINSVGLPSPEEMVMTRLELPQKFRVLTIDDLSGDEGPSVWPPPPSSHELDLADRTEQEKRDEELARLLQEEEEQSLDMVDRDRMMAIEAQDKEYAKMLQEKEKAKLRRAKLRAKARALAKKQLEDEMSRTNEGEPEPSTSSCPCDTGGKPRPKSRAQDDEDIISTVAMPGGAPLPNIAMAIDPTYSPKTSPAQSFHQEFDDEEGPAPPYMPVQGQKRSSSLEKKRKKDKAKEGCKQQ